MRPMLLAVGVTILMAVILWLDGRIWWCKSGDLAVYINQAWNSSHTSQHIFDPYSFTHILHGVLFFWITSILFKKLDVSWQIVLAVVAECGWELLENSNYIIEKYRANTASLDYFGDSICNSIGDVIACTCGFIIAHKLGWRRSIVFFFLVEVLLIFWIRDSLIINIIMLLHPIELIKQWQLGL